MPREYMERNAADNEYMHKDFHGALSGGLTYLREHYGEDSVREYLHDFAVLYYAPLREKIRQHGLDALREYFENLYITEGGEAEITMSNDKMILEVQACPAVMHMRSCGYGVDEMWEETTRSVNEGICEGTDFEAELSEYDKETGRSIQKFTRRTL